MLKKITVATQVVVAVAALFAATMSWNNRGTIKETKASVQEVHILLNSRLTELLEVTGALKKAEGVTQERKRQEGLE